MECPTHKTTLTQRNPATYEQKWCGDWFDCQQCGYSTLIPSNELNVTLTEQFDRVGIIVPEVQRKKRRKRA